MHVLLSIALAMAGGLVLSRVVKLLKLPNVTGYLIAGLIVGPCCLNLVNQTNLGYIKIISTVALGFIAFSIGGEFKLEHLKSSEKHRHNNLLPGVVCGRIRHAWTVCAEIRFSRPD